ncbi:hypothetical protein B0H11DRAFT_2189520 [Mycena galericulata]|nr:hypothetical protein B0H11DRAFT_2189520 [Mycena galericulata]
MELMNSRELDRDIRERERTTGEGKEVKIKKGLVATTQLIYRQHRNDHPAEKKSRIIHVVLHKHDNGLGLMPNELEIGLGKRIGGQTHQHRYIDTSHVARGRTNMPSAISMHAPGRRQGGLAQGRRVNRIRGARMRAAGRGREAYEAWAAVWTYKAHKPRTIRGRSRDEMRLGQGQGRGPAETAERGVPDPASDIFIACRYQFEGLEVTDGRGRGREWNKPATDVGYTHPSPAPPIINRAAVLDVAIRGQDRLTHAVGSERRGGGDVPQKALRAYCGYSRVLDFWLQGELPSRSGGKLSCPMRLQGGDVENSEVVGFDESVTSIPSVTVNQPHIPFHSFLPPKPSLAVYPRLSLSSAPLLGVVWMRFNAVNGTTVHGSRFICQHTSPPLDGSSRRIPGLAITKYA